MSALPPARVDTTKRRSHSAIAALTGWIRVARQSG